MKLDNETHCATAEEIALTDTELAAVLGGGNCPSYGGGYPSYGNGYPSYGGGYPSYGGGYPSYGGGYPSGCSGSPSYAPQYSSPFDTGGCSGSSTTTSYTVTTYNVSPAPSSCSGY